MDKQRLDIFLSGAIKSMTRSGAQKLITSGNVLVNDSVEKPSHKVRTEDVIVVTIEEAIPSEAGAEDIPIDIIYEDESIAVVNKAASMVVHPAVGNYTGTLVNALLHHLKDLSGIGGVMRPGIIHRLDKGTSGVIVIAKNDAAHNSLTEQFKDRTIVKKYFALIFGKMAKDTGIIESGIGRDKKNRKKISSNSSNQKEAVTLYELKRSYEGFSLLELTPKTGRTHQLRVQLSELGHPIVGDELYGGDNKLKFITDTALRKRLKELDRFLLHAAYIKFTHPKTNKPIEFSVPLPNDFEDVLKLL